MEENRNQKSISTEAFNELHKPLHVPANFDKEAGMTDQVLFVLGYLVEGSTNEIADKLHDLNVEIPAQVYLRHAEEILENLLKEGKVNARIEDGVVFYNLHKEVQPHKGEVPPEELDET